jgi:hypothetical protein
VLFSPLGLPPSGHLASSDLSLQLALSYVPLELTVSSIASKTSLARDSKKTSIPFMKNFFTDRGFILLRQRQLGWFFELKARRNRRLTLRNLRRFLLCRESPQIRERARPWDAGTLLQLGFSHICFGDTIADSNASVDRTRDSFPVLAGRFNVRRSASSEALASGQAFEDVSNRSEAF